MAGDNSKTNNAAEKKLSRRAFVTGSGTALVGGAIGAVAGTAPQEAEAAQRQGSYPLSTR